MDRRRFLRVSASAVAGIVGLDAFGVEPRWLEVTTHEVPVGGLPAALRGYTIAQLSDIHLSGLGHVHEAVLDALKRAQPELTVITGDAVDAVEGLPQLAELCRAIASRSRRVLATPGNWEYWGSVPTPALRKTYANERARLLVNESIALGDGVAVVAVDDVCAGQADPVRAIRNVPHGQVRLLLTHSPALFDDLPSPAFDFDLGLGGHTHGGQACPGGPIWLPPGSGRFRAGMYSTARGPVYVSRGIGTSVLPARFLCRPELPIFRLVQG